MWEIIGTALLSGSAGFVAGAYWIVKYKPARGVDLDEEDHREASLTLDIDTTGFDEAMARALRDTPSGVTHLVVGGTTGCCGVRTDKLPWRDLVTANEDAVTCKEVWW